MLAEAGRRRQPGATDRAGLLAATAARRFTRSRRHWLLRKPFVEAGRLRVAHSIIERVELPAMAPLHRELGRLLGRQLPAAAPHVTLYVAVRAQGTGVSSEARLRAFAVREMTALLSE